MTTRHIVSIMIVVLLFTGVCSAGDLSHNFNRNEFACPCCNARVTDAELVHRLEVLRKFFKQPIVITSGFRCVEHNKEVGGAKESQHLYGRAADIQIEGVPPQEVGRVAIEICGFSFVKIYKTWVHVDVR